MPWERKQHEKQIKYLAYCYAINIIASTLWPNVTFLKCNKYHDYKIINITMWLKRRGNKPFPFPLEVFINTFKLQWDWKIFCFPLSYLNDRLNLWSRLKLPNKWSSQIFFQLLFFHSLTRGEQTHNTVFFCCFYQTV